MLRSRDRELEAIERLLASAGAGRGGCLVLQGEPGIGKTALLAAVCAARKESVVYDLASLAPRAPSRHE